MTKPTGRPRGRPRKDATVRAIRGDPPLPPAQIIPPALTDPPESLSPAERAVWTIYAESLLDLGRLTALSWPALAELCRNEVMVAEMRTEIARDGLTVVGQKGEKVRHSMILPMVSMMNQVNVGRTVFGMTPAANERLAPAKVEHDGSDLLSRGWSG